MPEAVRDHRVQDIALVVHSANTADDKAAIALVRGEFNGRLTIVERSKNASEVLPALWVDSACYTGLDSIRYIIDLHRLSSKSVAAK